MNAIKAAKQLTGLVLEGNTLGVEAAKAIAKALESQPSFQRALWKDAFTGRLKDEIPKALVRKHTKHPKSTEDDQIKTLFVFRVFLVED